MRRVGRCSVRGAGDENAWFVGLVGCGRGGGCRRTQVLLPASVLLRRADAVTVIGEALVAKAGGAGHRPIAVGVNVPPSTVRGWLRRIAAVAPQVLAVLAVVAAESGRSRLN